MTQNKTELQKALDSKTLSKEKLELIQKAAQAYVDLPSKIEVRLRNNLIKKQECQDSGNINGMGYFTARNDELKSLLKEI